MKKYILISTILSSFLFADTIPTTVSNTVSPVMVDDTSAPIDANGNIISTDTNASLIGDDTLPDSNIDRGEVISVDLGDSNIYVGIDESGNRVVYNADGTIYDPNAEDNETISNYTAVQQEYINNYLNGTQDANQTIEDLVVQNAEDYKFKQKQITAADQVEGTINERKTYYLSGRSVPGEGQNIVSIFNTDINNLEAKRANGEELTDAEIAELNATKFYQSNVSYYKNFDTKKTMAQENTTALSNAYKDLDTIQTELTAIIKSGKIKCQITRNLMPTYYCPISGKEGLRFPASSVDSLKVDMQDVLDRCNEFCVSEPGDYPVIQDKIIETTEIDTGFTEKEIFPDFELDSENITINTNGLIPLGQISFTVSVPKPEDKTEEEWNEILKIYKPVFKFSMTYTTKNENGDIAVNSLFRRTPLYLSSTEQVFTFPVQVVGLDYNIKIYKPFFYKIGDDIKFKNEGGKIILKNIETKYISDSLWYCSVKQTVQFRNECYDPDNNTKQFSINGQDIYVCKDRAHKIGPEPTWGGFYTKEQAEDACIIQEPCLPRYVSSDAADATTVYKSTINCVDDPLNKECSDDLCEQLFQDQNKTILNEYYVELDKKDNVRTRYSIKNGSPTGILRPKINFDELSNVSDYSKLFESEEKDAAYLAMLNNLTFNRDKYRIGEESPAKTFYNIAGTIDNPILEAKLKPASFDYGSDDDMYVYGVLVMDHFFEPLYGSWYIDGHNIIVSDGTTQTYTNLDPYVNNTASVSSTTTVNTGTSVLNILEPTASGTNPVGTELPSVRFMDRTYAIKTGPENQNWQVFRRIKNWKFENTYNEAYIDENGEAKIRTKVEWVEIPAYTSDNIEKYDVTLGDYSSYDYQSEKAPYFQTTHFPKDQDFFSFILTNSMTQTYLNVPGGLIRDQEGINHNTSYKRLYNVPFSSKGHDSYIRNATYYLVYGDHKMTYEEILEEIEGQDWKTNPIMPYESKWGVYEVINSFKYNYRLSGDEELNNGIRMIKKGTPDKLTLSVDWEPKINEKGKKAYKFVFLYNDTTLNGD